MKQQKLEESKDGTEISEDLEREGCDYLIGIVELVVHEASDDAGFPDGLIPQEDEFVLGESRNGSHGDFGSMRIRSVSRSRSRRRFIGQIEISEPRSKFASFL